MSATPLLHADDLCVQRASDWHSTRLNIHLSCGQLLMLEGANGSGKSTVLRTLAGLYDDYSGACKRYARLAYLGHAKAGKESLSVADNLSWYCALMEMPQERVRSCMERFLLTEHANRPLRSLSAGQKQRVAVARLFLSDAPIWLLDEPEQSLDKEGNKLLTEAINEHCAAGGAVVRTRASSGELRVAAGEGTQQVEQGAQKSATPSFGGRCAALWSLWRRDVRLLLSQHRVWRMPILFALAVLLPALVVVLDRTAFNELLAVLMWSLALLVICVGGDELCAADWEDDTLAQLVLANIALWQLALIRVAALWCTVILPIALAMMLLGLMLGMSVTPALVMMVSMMVGGVTLTLLVAVGGALCAPLKDRSVLSALILIPLALPVLLFGALTSEVAALGGNIMPGLALQTALALAASMLLPPLIVMGWRTSVSV